ncbi:hypothetical protein ACOAKC_09535 [Hathewaya histolytica]|uniref:hypothetical protein n=1 Tax=Hathewaya histolytica TaxID=1498 RepID=UPI003B674DFA
MNRNLKNKILGGVISLFLLTPITVTAANQVGMKGPSGGSSGTADYHKLHSRWVNILTDKRGGWAETGWKYVYHYTKVEFARSKDSRYKEGFGYTKTTDVTGTGWVYSHYNSKARP